VSIVKYKLGLIQIRTHISFFLFWIFFTPILFQSIHIVWHHSDAHQCEHHLCISEASDQMLKADDTQLSEKEEKCPICEYEFPINNIPKVSSYDASLPIFSSLYTKTLTQKQFIKVISKRNPRAPPVYCTSILA